MQTLRLIRTGKICADEPRYTRPEAVYDDFKWMMRLDREHFVALHLDGKNRVIAKETVSIGSLNQTIVHPREVFKAAVHNGSAALIAVHNHPTGDPTPSREDIDITRRLDEAGAIIGIKLIDHIIIGSSSFSSMVAMGLLEGGSSSNKATDIEPPAQSKPHKKPSPWKRLVEKPEIIRQYVELKSENPDRLVLFDLDKMFVFFLDDAVKAARVLGVKLRSVEVGGFDLSCYSFPRSRKDAFIAGLVATGEKVAICSPGK